MKARNATFLQRGARALALTASIVLLGCAGGTPSPQPADETGATVGKGCGGERGGCACRRRGQGGTLTFSSGPLTETEIAALTLQHQEERVSRALYQALADKDHVFGHVAAMEEGHRDWLGEALRAHGSQAPTPDAALDAAHAERLATLGRRGDASREEAFRVGVENEEADIARLATMASQAQSADVKALFERLGSDSEHHRMMFSHHGAR